MPRGILYNIMQTDTENYMPVLLNPGFGSNDQKWQTTSEKVKEALTKFPSTKPESYACAFSPVRAKSYNFYSGCISTNCADCHRTPSIPGNNPKLVLEQETCGYTRVKKGKAWHAIVEAIQLLQLGVTVAAVILYYFMYGFMQLVYTGLRVSLFFHQADGPTKILLGMVTVTSLVVVFNVLMRIQKIYTSILR